MKAKIIFILLAQLSLISCSQEVKTKEEIIKKYVTNGAKKFNYKFQMQEWQQCLDEGLKIDSTVAYLWQQKAMPYFKARKYEIGMQYIDKAVQYDSESWQPYRAFIKCVFAKRYKDAIVDFEDCKKRFGNNYVMDHTYNFYIALSYLQLNEFKKAEKLLQGYVDDLFNELGEEWLHPTALFYLGISKYEQNKYKAAIIEFDRALKLYPELSEANYYKSICLMKTKQKENAKLAFQKFKFDSEKGYSINEDNAIYEVYPYQVKSK